MGHSASETKEGSRKQTMKAVDLSAGRLPCPTAGHQLCRDGQAISAYSLTFYGMVSCGITRVFTVGLHQLFLRATNARKPLKPACTIPCVVQSYFFTSFAFIINSPILCPSFVVIGLVNENKSISKSKVFL